MRESKENLFTGKMLPNPDQQKFFFRDRLEKLDMRRLYNIDLDKIKNTNSMQPLNQILENVVYGYVDQAELEKYGDEVFIKMIKVLQFVAEYLIYTQEYISELCVQVD